MSALTDAQTRARNCVRCKGRMYSHAAVTDILEELFTESGTHQTHLENTLAEMNRTVTVLTANVIQATHERDYYRSILEHTWLGRLCRRLSPIPYIGTRESRTHES